MRLCAESLWSCKAEGSGNCYSSGENRGRCAKGGSEEGEIARACRLLRRHYMATSDMIGGVIVIRVKNGCVCLCSFV